MNNINESLDFAWSAFPCRQNRNYSLKAVQMRSSKSQTPTHLFSIRKLYQIYGPGVLVKNKRWDDDLGPKWFKVYGIADFGAMDAYGVLDNGYGFGINPDEPIYEAIHDKTT